MNVRLTRLLTLLGLLISPVLWAMPAEQAPAAPAFDQSDPSAWINSPPLTLAGLRGQVVLVEFWTYGCSNCLRSIPWVKAMSERYQDEGLKVVGVHTPEFSYERPRAAVKKQVKALAIRHPVMLDNDYSYWNAMGNRYWPAFYLIDRQGRMRQAWAGEVRNGSQRGRRMQQAIEALLTE